MLTGTVFSHSALHRAIKMASTENKISKLGAAVITRDITLTLPGKCEIFRTPGSATSHGVNMAA